MPSGLVASLLVSCLLVAVPSWAQSISGGGTLGLVIGDTRSDEPLYDSTPKGGFAAGGFISFALGHAFSVEPQLFVVQKGARVNGQTIKLHYVEVPVVAALALPKWGDVKPFVYGGPAFGLNVSAKAAVIGRPIDEDISDDIKGTDVGVTYGGGINIDRLTLEARYTHGLSNIAKRGPALTTRAFLLLGGFSFP